MYIIVDFYNTKNRRNIMKRKLKYIGLCTLMAMFIMPIHYFAVSAYAPYKLDNVTIVNNEQSSNLATSSYTIVSGDTMWKIAVKFEIGLSELIKANPHIANPALIYVGQVLTIPNAAPLQSLEDEVIRLVNVERSKYGLQSLTKNWEASRVARYKSQDMIDKGYFAHISPTYGSPFQMMEDFGLRFSAAAENIAYGQTTAQDVMNAWMNSDGHRANILNRSYSQIGVGAAKSYNGTLYWTQMFLKPIG